MTRHSSISSDYQIFNCVNYPFIMCNELNGMYKTPTLQFLQSRGGRVGGEGEGLLVDMLGWPYTNVEA